MPYILMFGNRQRTEEFKWKQFAKTNNCQCQQQCEARQEFFYKHLPKITDFWNQQNTSALFANKHNLFS